MHELSIAQSILDIVNQHLPSSKAAKVRSIKIRVGKLSNILPDSLHFCFGALTKGSNFEKTQLIIKAIPLTIECKDCKKIYETDDYIFLCPSCNSSDIAVLGGNDLNIEEIEIE